MNINLKVAYWDDALGKTQETFDLNKTPETWMVRALIPSLYRRVHDLLRAGIDRHEMTILVPSVGLTSVEFDALEGGIVWGLPVKVTSRTQVPLLAFDLEKSDWVEKL